MFVIDKRTHKYETHTHIGISRINVNIYIDALEITEET